MDSINRIRSVFDPFGTAKPAAPKKQAPKWIQDAIAPQRAKPNLTPRAAPPASISATPWSLGGWLEDKTARALGGLVGEREGARLGAKLFSAINDFTPVGDAVGMDEGGRQVYQGLSRGHLGQAALGAGTFALSALPGVLERPIRSVARNNGLGNMFTSLLRDEAGTFGGVNAKTADLAALERAQAMTSKGASRDDIWRDTGWFKGVDDKWRFEIDDSDFGLKNRSRGVAGIGDGRVYNHYEHPELFAAYPEADAVGLTTHGLGQNNGFYDPKKDQIGVFPLLPESKYGSPVEFARNEGRHLSTVGHELQHKVQRLAGFAQGGSPDEFVSSYNIANAAIHDVNKRLGEVARLLDTEKSPEALAALREEYDSLMSHKLTELVPQARLEPLEQYRRLAGEVESRNVETRLGWTPEQRRQTPPWASQDVPDEQQIVRFR